MYSSQVSLHLATRFVFKSPALATVYMFTVCVLIDLLGQLDSFLKLIKQKRTKSKAKEGMGSYFYISPFPLSNLVVSSLMEVN